MKIKYNWIVLAITALASLGLGTWQAIVNARGGDFFLDRSLYTIVIFGLTIFAFIFGAVLTIIDRETPKTYNIGKNFFAGFFGLLVSICYASDGLIGFTSLSGQDYMILFIITKLFEICAGGVFLAESVSLILGKNLLKNKPLLTIVVPIMFAFRLIMLFFEYAKISVQSSEMFDIVAVAFASLFMYYHAVMFAGLKKSCVKSLFLFGAPMICVALASATDIVVAALLVGEFRLSDMIMTVADALLCLYTVCLLAEITHKAGRQYLNDFADEVDISIPEKATETEDDETDEDGYSSFEDIASFGRRKPHIRRETILSEPAASVEQKHEVASHAHALHEALSNNLEISTDEKAVSLRSEPTTQPEAEEMLDSKPRRVRNDDDLTLADTNTSTESELIPEPESESAPSDDSPSPSSASEADGVDMDRINRLLSEFERDHM